MNEQINAIARLLDGVLQRQAQFTHQLLNCAEKVELALIGNNVQDLRAAIDAQEDISLHFEQEDRVRRQQVKRLAALLHAEDDGISLKELVRLLPDRQSAERLGTTGRDLAQVTEKVRRKNDTIREILALKSEYVDTMLGLLSGGQDARSQGYNAQGGLTKTYDDSGIYEVLI